jgi:hypothetical protein
MGAAMAGGRRGMYPCGPEIAKKFGGRAESVAP